jgi:predicted RNase H-like HicB family nuclease
MRTYTIILSPDPDAGGFTAICPAMPRAVTEGDTREEALEAMSGVMEAWLDIAAEDGYGPREESAELIAAAVANVLHDREESGWDRTIQTCMLPVGTSVAA